MVAPQRWIHLFAVGRLTGVLVAVLLLAVHRVTDHDGALIWAALAWGALTIAAALARPSLFGRWPVWVVDAFVVLALIVASENWRSPFYLLALSSLGPPAAALPLRPALSWGAGFAFAFGVAAIITGLDLASLRTTARLDTFATHLILPMVATAGVAYTADALRRLERERRRSERLAVETERRRIAWELHDSAKQRLHAAALMLSALDGRADDPVLTSALQQVRGATADMETSIAELRSPLEGRKLHVALRARAEELRGLTSASIAVEGKAPDLPDVTATHVYRIVSEAMANAVRHARAENIDVRIGQHDGSLVASVVDDGQGIPDDIRPGANGLLTMRSRAFAVGAKLKIEPGPAERGTSVTLDLPLQEGATSS